MAPPQGQGQVTRPTASTPLPAVGQQAVPDRQYFGGKVVQMRTAVTAAIVLVVVALGGSLFVCWVAHVREVAAHTACKNKLKQIGFGLNNYHDSYGAYPPGTLPNESLPPERRLSWFAANWGYFGDGQVHLVIDRTQGWDSVDNNCTSTIDVRGEGNVPLNVGGFFHCPANPNRGEPGRPDVTHYVGIAGLGQGAATFQVSYPGAGLFGYDRQVRDQDITGGTSTTMAVAETMLKNGPWTAGGLPTIRALDPEGVPYLGSNGQFGSLHRGTNVLFIDGSIQTLDNSVDPRVFQAMATIAGKGDVGRE
jgi:hypothetical protein